ncbi:hypothetical protein C7S20_19225 [Christiangramia fulva]|uniref:Uncharacterized protein n=1 Tax=Christiangramia fulva TaxID=2126553 RepID=A0A2R3ZAF2_9FLAO|nr:hypothetical protein [Christiangramia fulva]AVR47210.1 hypothetical protein C7S20_19225 [Christiangramia fulva]
MYITSSSGQNSVTDGIRLEQLVQKYDLFKVQKLVKYNLIIIDNSNRVYLTDKGKIARKFGFEKLIELENLEKKILKRNMVLWTLKNGILYFSLITLIILLVLITIQII